MVAFSIDLSSIDEWMQKAQRIEPEWTSAINETLTALATLFMHELMIRIPVDTGDYWESWEIGPIQGTQIIIHTDQGDLYFILEWTGSLPHDIDAKPEGPMLKIPLKNGDVIFRWHVHHPGFPPIPHVGPALMALEQPDKGPRIIREKLLSRVEFFKNSKQ